MEEYRYLATSREGFIQQTAVCYVGRGYCFFVQGRIPEGKDPELLDQKLLKRYSIAKNKKQRWRRKRNGLANVQYIRFERDWLMLATKGEHEWFREERGNIRDCRRQPIRVLGYSISSVQGNCIRNCDKVTPNGPPERDTKNRVRIQMSRAAYRSFQNLLLENVRRRRSEWFAARLYESGFEPYAPVRKQLLSLLRQVNKARSAAGLSKISVEAIRYQRRPVRPFAVS